jgi:hypothetical protein
MRKHYWILGVVSASLIGGIAVAQQFPLLDRVADRVVQKYQTASCEQLAEQRATNRNRPRSPAEERVIRLLREDPGMRAEFFKRVSAPIVSKMFECGMIP